MTEILVMSKSFIVIVSLRSQELVPSLSKKSNVAIYDRDQNLNMNSQPIWAINCLQ